MLLVIYSGFFCGIWVLIYLSLMYTLRQVPMFENVEVNSSGDLPKLSVIVPACNEGEHLEQAAKTLIAQNYPGLEIILVNDRSTDNTREIIDRLAKENLQVKAVHIQELPENWIGKVHALAEGKKQATGEWLLFTDADIRYAPGLLRKSVAYAQSQSIDHLALMPGVEMNNFLLEVAVQSFGLLFLLTTHAARVNKPGSKSAIGVGAFNLVKTETFEKTPGFEWLRMETVDDMGVGVMVKNCGGQSHFAVADKELKLGWYESLPAMFRGLEKNLFGAGPGYSVFKLSFQLLYMWSLIITPFIALSSENTWLFSLGIVVLSLYLIFSIFFIREKRSETLRLLLFPLGLVLLTVMMIWAAYKCIKNNGIDWRGTHYTLAQLRAGQRVRF